VTRLCTIWLAAGTHPPTPVLAAPQIRAGSSSQLRLAIEHALDSGLPRAYSPELYQKKCSAIFEHVYESYPERDAGVYAQSPA
jgi:hypothetical protein